MDNMKDLCGYYRHYKGGIYDLLHVARHSETGEELAIYRRLNGTPEENKVVWARPLGMFLEELPEELAKEVGQKYRFVLIKEFDDAPVKKGEVEEDG